MNKRQYLLLFFAVVSLVTNAETYRQTNDSQLFTLKNGELTMTINASKGGRILSLKHQDQEMLSQSPWPESFGSTFWTSPQKEWNWPPVPEFDKQPYKVEEQDANHLTIKSPVSQKLGLSIGKAFQTDTSKGGFVVTYTIKNEGNDPRRVAPWEITRVTNENGIIFFEACDNKIWPSGLMNFKEQEGAMWYLTDTTDQNRKVNADGKGWLAYYANDLLLIKQFQDLQADEPAPEEAEVQVYVNRGKTYIELESQGAYTLLQPGDSLCWTVRWYLLPVDQHNQQPDQLLKAVNQCIHQ